MSIELLYLLSLVIPILLVPVLLPMVMLMAQRKRLTDAPNARKAQDRPVAVMGGMVIMLVICATLIFVNVFYDITLLFPAVCVMVILFIFGMLDDIIGLSWQFKLMLQVAFILMLYYGGNYGVDSLYGLFGIDAVPGWASLLLTIFSGLMILNAVNFVDGIDGLASGLGMLAAFFMGYWNVRHGFMTQALLSYTMTGVLFAFFLYNVFSERYKMYMGDSGSLVLGLFVFISVCPDYQYALEEFLVDNYFVSFLVALLSAMLFDLFRVAGMRALNGKSPFQPDRTHLHHVYVDAGMSHLVATGKIVFSNLVMIVVWYLTASSGMRVGLQYFLILIVGLFLFWGPYFYLVSIRERRPERYAVISKRCTRRSKRLESVSNFITNVIDFHRRPIFTHRIK